MQSGHLGTEGGGVAAPVVEPEEEPFSDAVSLGSLCLPAAWLRAHGMRLAAFPFDWIHSSAAMVRHCLRDDFRTLLDRSQYFAAGRDGFGHATYTPMLLGRGEKVVWRHHDPLRIPRDYELLRRCVGRLRSSLRRRRFLCRHKLLCRHNRHRWRLLPQRHRRRWQRRSDGRTVRWLHCRTVRLFSWMSSKHGCAVRCDSLHNSVAWARLNVQVAVHPLWTDLHATPRDYEWRHPHAPRRHS